MPPLVLALVAVMFLFMSKPIATYQKQRNGYFMTLDLLCHFEDDTVMGCSYLPFAKGKFVIFGMNFGVLL